MTLGVGEQFPHFKMKATVTNDLDNAFVEISHESYPGKWKVVFFYPKDFTFVCPTEIKAFGDLNEELMTAMRWCLAVPPTANLCTLPGAMPRMNCATCPFPCWLT